MEQIKAFLEGSWYIIVVLPFTIIKNIITEYKITAIIIAIILIGGILITKHLKKPKI